jgi:hypothetical protein
MIWYWWVAGCFRGNHIPSRDLCALKNTVSSLSVHNTCNTKVIHRQPTSGGSAKRKQKYKHNKRVRCTSGGSVPVSAPRASLNEKATQNNNNTNKIQTNQTRFYAPQVVACLSVRRARRKRRRNRGFAATHPGSWQCTGGPVSSLVYPHPQAACAATCSRAHSLWCYITLRNNIKYKVRFVYELSVLLHYIAQ